MCVCVVCVYHVYIHAHEVHTKYTQVSSCIRMESHGGSDVVVRTIQALAGLKAFATLFLQASQPCLAAPRPPLVKFENFPMWHLTLRYFEMRWETLDLSAASLSIRFVAPFFYFEVSDSIDMVRHLCHPRHPLPGKYKAQSTEARLTFTTHF